MGFCYDSGHEHYYTPNIDWLSLYGNRTFAIHLHDNNGDKDSHLPPFHGNINWDKKAKEIAKCSYNGSITIESEYENCKEYEKQSFQGFLKTVYDEGTHLNNLIEQNKYKDKVK